eukprot:8768406-Lingulodinium_polyedra.AAC.1
MPRPPPRLPSRPLFRHPARNLARNVARHFTIWRATSPAVSTVLRPVAPTRMLVGQSFNSVCMVIEWPLNGH